MSDREHRSSQASDNDRVETNDITAVLSALQSLAAKTSHPVVRACLEQAHEDIAHLTS